MGNNSSPTQSLSTSLLISNFPFTCQRDNQTSVLNQICDAFNSKVHNIGGSYRLWQKSCGNSRCYDFGLELYLYFYQGFTNPVCKDFPYLKTTKGKNNFPCLVKEDFIKNNTYRCGICVSDNANECYHTTVEYGPCKTNESFKDSGCKSKPFLKSYKVSNKGTKHEQVFIDIDSKNYYQKEYSQWLHLQNVKEKSPWN